MNWLLVVFKTFFGAKLWYSRAMCLCYGIFAHALYTSKDPEMTALFHVVVILGVAGTGAIMVGLLYAFEKDQTAKNKEKLYQWYGKPDDPAKGESCSLT